MSDNCTPCSTSASGDGPLIVAASKYASVMDAYGRGEVLKPKENSILVHRSGSKPVSWADGSVGDRIQLDKLEKSPKWGANILMQDNSGFLYGSTPDPEKGKQQLVFDGSAVGWEIFGSNRHCFNQDQILEANGCGYQIAAFTTCGPDGQVCLVKVPASECGFLKADGTVEEASPPGVIQMYGGTPASVPAGWLLCDGRIVDSATYSALFERIGYNFGRSGSNFYLPDMRGNSPRGVDDIGIRDSGYASRTELNPGGNVAENVGSYQEDAFQCHDHTGGGDLTVTKAHTTIGGGETGAINYVSEVSQGGTTDGAVTGDSCEADVDPRTANETRVKNVYVNFIISAGC